ncbi:hypothetical protein D3C73_1359850 [compost metagenome]
MLLDQGQPEEVAQPRQDPLGPFIRDVAQSLSEGFPLEEFGVRLGRFDEFVLVLVEEGCSLVLGELVGALQCRTDFCHHRLHAVCEEGPLAFLIPQRQSSLLD